MPSLAVALAACLAAGGTAGGASPPAGPSGARNVVLLIADGAGYNTFLAASMYEGRVGTQVYDGAEWIHLAASVDPLRRERDAPFGPEWSLVQLPGLAYDPLKAWDGQRVDGGQEAFPFFFGGYQWLRSTRPDSAATATALSTGLKTYNGAINVDGQGRPIERTLARLAREAGKRVGVVTSVPFSDATPAALGGAHHASRLERVEIAREMLRRGELHVVAGCGHPDFDNNGRPVVERRDRIYDHVGGAELWRLLRGEEPATGGAPWNPPAEQLAAYRSWTLVDSREAIEALREGPTPDRLLIVPRVGQLRFWTGESDLPSEPLHHARLVGATLQQQRGSRANPRYTAPGDDPELAGVPSLAALTAAAINALDDHPGGFLLIVEGGAVDWAMHERQLGRMVEEMMAFNRAAETVVGWVDALDAWTETLVIVTADHDHMLWGPLSDRSPFAALVDHGPGRLPGYRWLYDDHSSALVPLHARGAGAERLAAHADLADPVRGAYLDQTEVFEVVRSVLGAAAGR
jgi:alkaline phosphatase